MKLKEWQPLPNWSKHWVCQVQGKEGQETCANNIYVRERHGTWQADLKFDRSVWKWQDLHSTDLEDAKKEAYVLYKMNN